jgi:hypothetical protein
VASGTAQAALSGPRPCLDSAAFLWRNRAGSAPACPAAPLPSPAAPETPGVSLPLAPPAAPAAAAGSLEPGLDPAAPPAPGAPATPASPRSPPAGPQPALRVPTDLGTLLTVLRPPAPVTHAEEFRALLDCLTAASGQLDDWLAFPPEVQQGLMGSWLRPSGLEEATAASSCRAGAFGPLTAPPGYVCGRETARRGSHRRSIRALGSAPHGFGSNASAADPGRVRGKAEPCGTEAPSPSTGERPCSGIGSSSGSKERQQRTACSGECGHHHAPRGVVRPESAPTRSTRDPVCARAVPSEGCDPV